MREAYVNMLASKRYGTLYIAVTSDLVSRIWEHKSVTAEGFAKRYAVNRLVWYEEHGSIEDAIEREKNMKRWRRDWKIALISRTNPAWRDLYKDII